MARRRSFMATRMSKMRGLDRSEKEILMSIGQIVDQAVNNRTPTNPTGTIRKSGRSDPKLPPVSNLNVDAGVRSVKITWNPVDGSILENYAITITNLGTGVTTENISYTSHFIFKGESGDYKAIIKPIGRNGVAAPVKQIFFTIPDSVMILEGTKNSTVTEGPFVSEVVLTPADYQVFAWTAFTLNSFASPTQNNEPIVQLLYGDDLATATLIQSVTMFQESETFTNLNDLDYGGIFRPAGGGTREGNFETSFTIMFAPFEIPDAIAGQTTRFWINVTNRDVEADVISCSIVLWVGSGGRGELGETPVATVNPRSIDLNGSNERMAGPLDRLAAELEDQFTVAFWVKPFDLQNFTSTPQYFRLLPDNIVGQNNVIAIFYDFTTITDTNMGFSIVDSAGAFGAAFQANGPLDDIWTNGENNWNFLTGVWDRSQTGVDRLKLYINGVLYVTTGSVLVTNGADIAPDIDRNLTTYGGDYFIRAGAFQGVNTFAQARFNSMGTWNTPLSAAAILELYNNGAGANVDWRINVGNYSSASNLQHYWLFGLDTTDDLTICNDYGNSSFALINLNDPAAGATNIEALDDVVNDAPV